MNRYGLIGFPLSHSFSQKYFTEKFQREGIQDSVYQNFSISAISLLPDLLELTTDLCGLNVTIPYKEQVIPFLNEIDPVAQEIGAVNTIKIRLINKDKRLYGYNTDAFGFENSIKPFLKPNHTKALILGTGGASKAVAFVFKKLQIDFLYVSRTPVNQKSISYSDLTETVLHDFKIIVNTTPLGTYPDIHTFPPLNYQHLTQEHLLYDLVYNPAKTEFLSKGKIFGATIVNGLAMLHLQAEKSWEIYRMD